MNTFMAKLYIKALNAKDSIKKLMTDERGETNLIAIILILAVVIVLVIAFKDAIGNLFDKIWGSIDSSVDDVI